MPVLHELGRLDISQNELIETPLVTSFSLYSAFLLLITSARD